MVGHVDGSPIRYLDAEMDRNDSVAGLHHCLHDMLDHKEGNLPLVSDPEYQVDRLVDLFLIEAGENLIQQKELGADGQCTGNFETLPVGKF